MEAAVLIQQKAEELKDVYRKMILRVTMVRGKDPAKLRRVGASEFNSAPDDKLITFARNAHLFLEENLTALFFNWIDTGYA